MIAIIDYGMGNIHSVSKALELYTAKVLVTNKPEDIDAAKKIVLPGVGAFGEAMQELKKQGLASKLKEAILNKKAFLGICLGMQLLFEESEESPGEKGLGILKGKVRRFQNRPGLKVPHMGWNQIKTGMRGEGIGNSECPLLKDITNNAYVYFCHSYYPQPQNKGVVAASCEYGDNFAAVVWQENIYGVQFHPEKSQGTGLRMLENFVKAC